ncbi:MAG TPA: hypothetical protein VN700_20265 [Vicinamibacterales bacterium]|nr:hypothetical protein [Vicinamibacterales bacterium]
MSLLEFDAPPDEYSPEVGTVVPRVVRASSPDEVRAILHEELERWFGEGSVGRPEGFQAPADSIWKAVLAFRQVD